MSKFKRGDKVKVKETGLQSFSSQCLRGRVCTITAVYDNYVSLEEEAEVRPEDISKGFGGVHNCEIEFLEPVKEETKVKKFKAGDKVRFIRDISDISFGFGKIYNCVGFTHYDYSGAGCVSVEKDDQGRPNGWSGEYFEVVNEIETVEGVVNKLNEYRKFVREVFSIYANQIERRENTDSAWTNASDVSVSKHEYRVKPTPTMVPWKTSNGWEVYLTNDFTNSTKSRNIRIGCQEFDVKRLRDTLESLIESNSTSSTFDHLRLSATRKGVYWKEYTLPWADADLLLKELKKLV
jgi:hypothetical protein